MATTIRSKYNFTAEVSEAIHNALLHFATDRGLPLDVFLQTNTVVRTNGVKVTRASKKAVVVGDYLLELSVEDYYTLSTLCLVGEGLTIDDYMTSRCRYW